MTIITFQQSEEPNISYMLILCCMQNKEDSVYLRNKKPNGMNKLKFWNYDLKVIKIMLGNCATTRGHLEVLQGS